MHKSHICIAICFKSIALAWWAALRMAPGWCSCGEGWYLGKGVCTAGIDGVDGTHEGPARQHRQWRSAVRRRRYAEECRVEDTDEHLDESGRPPPPPVPEYRPPVVSSEEQPQTVAASSRSEQETSQTKRPLVQANVLGQSSVSSQVAASSAQAPETWQRRGPFLRCFRQECEEAAEFDVFGTVGDDLLPVQSCPTHASFLLLCANVRVESMDRIYLQTIDTCIFV